MSLARDTDLAQTVVLFRGARAGEPFFGVLIALLIRRYDDGSALRTLLRIRCA